MSYSSMPRPDTGLRPHEGATPRPFWVLLAIVALAALYLATARLGLMLTLGHPNASPVWLATGLALAALLLGGYWLWPGVAIGALIASLPASGNIATAVAIALGNTLATITGAWLVNRFAEGARAFDRVATIVRYVALAAVGASAIDATIGVNALAINGQVDWTNFASIWMIWWIGDAASVLTITPLLLVWLQPPAPTLTARRVAEMAALALLLAGVSAMVMAGRLPPQLRAYPLGFLCLPLLLWATYRFGQRGAISACVIVGCIALAGLLQGAGPFHREQPSESLLVLQSYLAVVTTTMLVLAAVIARQRAADDQLIRTQDRYRSLVAASSQIVWSTNAHGDVVEDLPTWRAFTGQTYHEMRGHGWMASLHPDDVAEIRRLWEHSLATGAPHESEHRIRRHDGEYRWMFVRAVPVFEADGKLREWVGTCTDVTDRRNAQDSLRESEERFRLLADSAPVLVWMAGVDTRFDFFNKRWLEFTGRSLEQELGDGWAQGVHPDDLPDLMASYLESFNAQREFRLEYRLRRHDGAYRWMLAHGVPMTRPDGLFIGFIGTCIDITDRREIEQALRDSEERLRLAIEAAGLGTWEIDLVAGVVTQSQRVAEMLALPTSETTCDLQAWINHVHPDDRERVQREFADALAGEADYETEFRVMTPDGAVRWVAPKGKIVRDRAGKSQRAMGVIADITQRKQAEQSLRDSQERLQLSMQAGHMGAWEWDIDSGRVVWTPGLEAIHGLSPGAFGGRIEDVLRDIHAKDRQLMLEAIERALSTGEHHVTYRIMRPDGEEAWLEAHGRVLRDDQGKPVRMIGVCADITQRKRIEEQLARHNDLLEEMVRRRTAELEESHQQLRLTERLASIGTLVAGLGHDIGNLVLPIRLRLDAMQASELPREVVEGLAAIRSCTEYLQRLSNGLRLFAMQPDEGDSGELTDLELWWLDVELLLRNAVPRHVSFDRQFEPNLPSVRIARQNLTMAVFNLIQNASDVLAEQASGRILVSAHAAENGRFVRVVVSDNGPGMTPEVRLRCLEPLFTTKKRAISTGLGLSMVHGIVQQAGGTITIDSEVGQGTSVVLSLPCEQPVGHESRGQNRGLALVTLSDQRLQAYIAALLKSMAYEVAPPDQPPTPETRLWVTDPDADRLTAATAFLAGDRQRLVVICGAAAQSGAEISGDRVIRIADVNLSTIRSSLADLTAQIAR